MDLWDLPEDDAPEVEEVAPPDPDSVPTFLPQQLAVHDCPLSQYVPFHSLNPEEQAAAATMFRELHDRAQTYVLAFVETWDARLAAQRADWAPGQEPKLPPKERTKNLLALLRQADQRFAAKKAGITRERYLQELQAIAFFDPATLYDPVTGAPRDVHQLPAQARRALMIMRKTGGKHGNESRLTPHEKLPALRMMGETLGYDAPVHNVLPKVQPRQIIFVQAQPVSDPEPTEETAADVPDRDDGGCSLSRQVIYPFRAPSV